MAEILDLETTALRNLDEFASSKHTACDTWKQMAAAVDTLFLLRVIGGKSEMEEVEWAEVNLCR